MVDAPGDGLPLVWLGPSGEVAPSGVHSQALFNGAQSAR